MNGTPRLRSAFPQTPQTAQRTRKSFGNTTPSLKSPGEPKPATPRVAQNADDSPTPLIPVDLVDAPSQRLYVVAFYIALNAWRLYESLTASDDLDSTWLFLKWNTIDGVFLFGLQALRIPWLEWAFPTTLAIFLVHMVGNVFLMFRIPVCAAYCFYLTMRTFLLKGTLLIFVGLDTGHRMDCGNCQVGLR